MIDTSECKVKREISISEEDIKRNGDLAVTLDPDYLGYNPDTGWNVMGSITEDYYTWVNYFEAENIIHRDWIICGNFEDGYIMGSCKEALEDFLTHYIPSIWDYGDI